MATLETRLKDAFQSVGNRSKLLLTLMTGNLTDLSTLKTTAKTSLLAAINELYDRASGAGTGDMSKATYDSNNDGIVDRATTADGVVWTGVTGKPASYPPSAHDASLITSGTIDPARIPVLPSQKQIPSSGGIADLTASQQADIGQGTVVTTTDGYRWVYSGTGSKTAEASYTQLADITPEWSAIANKPSTLAGYNITDAVTKASIGNTDVDLVAVFETALAS